MANYRIEPAGTAFRVIDPWGEYLVDSFLTREAAQRDIDRCKREDEMCETAKQLVGHRHRSPHAEVRS
jgi:hypothetical protein